LRHLRANLQPLYFPADSAENVEGLYICALCGICGQIPTAICIPADSAENAEGNLYLRPLQHLWVSMFPLLNYLGIMPLIKITGREYSGLLIFRNNKT
jgi:hypothetical protein